MWATKRICNTQRQWIKLKEGRLRGCILLKCQQFRTGVLNYSSLKTIRFKSTCSISWGKDEQMIMDMIATVNAEGVKIASGKDPKEQCDEKQHILKEKMKHLNLSFAACGFLGIYHLGAAAAFYRHGENLLKVVKAFAGASAGSLAATVLLTAPEKIEDCKEFTYNFAEETRKLDFGAVTPGYDFMKRLRGGIESILPSDAHERAGNRLYVSITNTKNGENYLVSNFASREDLIKVLLASSFVPIYAGIKAVEYKGENHPLEARLASHLCILRYRCHNGGTAPLDSACKSSEAFAYICKSRERLCIYANDVHLGGHFAVRTLIKNRENTRHA
ncbi:patatin-like phospholipase domain-containing protein 4 isoform X3 [Alligator sinensis]|uniref:Patatin-like phospholipase domain-containing protein 4 isoform X3 n=1 Tax=Alligator sinensis TaxID=38654 RepID=A0A3Q0H9L1_ALLSI|nr:patatin-like phospholipase domain-containing protein 4 isoform X3 [Alligator sinensis]